MNRRDFFRSVAAAVPIGALCLAQSQAAEATPAKELHQFVPQKCTRPVPGVFVYEKFIWVEGLTFTGQFLSIRTDMRVIFSACAFINCGEILHGPNVTFNSCTTLTKNAAGYRVARLCWGAKERAIEAMLRYPWFAEPNCRKHFILNLPVHRSMHTTSMPINADQASS